VEREWTKALCGSDSSALASLNAAMKRIDLTCLIASPIVVGLLAQNGGGLPPMAAATLGLLAWNLVSWAPEVLLLRLAQRRSPALAADKKAAAAPDSTRSSSASSGAKLGWRERLLAGLRRQAGAWGLYARQPAAAAALALALLYLTVLSWGTLMTAYVKSLGLPGAELAVYRG
jgi:iron-regulated transporter 1